MTTRALALLLAMCLQGSWILPVAAQGASQNILTEFKKYIGSKDAAVRKDQVERLSRVDNAESVELLIQHGLLDDTYLVRDRAVWSLTRLHSPEARAALTKALSHSNAVVREGAALAYGESKEWKDRPVQDLALLFEKERNEQARVAQAFALGMTESKDATAVLVAALSHNKEAIVIAAADALALIKDPSAAKALEPLLDNVSWRVQVAGLHAMSETRVKESVQPCIAYLADATGRPREDAHRALKRITLRTFGMNPATWQEWWDRVKTTWEVPPRQAEKKEEKAQEDGGGYARSPGKPTRYHRITTLSKEMTFVIDISTSMLDPILLKQGRDTKKADPMYGSARKIDIAREELAHTLRGLESTTRFTLVAFETDVREWKSEPVTASPGNVQAAIKWLERQEPRRPGGSGFKASSGIDSDGRIVGRTNTYGALRRIFGFKGDARGGVTHGSRGPKPKWDTCFFLTDGRPTEGTTIEIPEILADVERWNKSARVRIHCIGMSQEQGLQTLIHGLAEITGGEAVFLGK